MVNIEEGPNAGHSINIPLEREELEFGYGADRAEFHKVCTGDGCNIHFKPMAPPRSMPSNIFTIPGVPPTQYALDECVLRMPSEHTVNHNHYPLEVQCHHTMEDEHGHGKRKGILSTLYEVGVSEEDGESFSPWVETFVDQLPPDSGAPRLVMPFNFGMTGSAGPSRYYTYDGSQTGGDCSEDATWYIMYDPVGISQAQLDKLMMNMTHHASGWHAPRALQDLNGRHPYGCHHAHVGSTTTASIGALSLILAMVSFFGRA
jgi:hypothetical protein